jgi:chlorite dismutase
LSDHLIFASYPVFRAIPESLGDERDVAVKEATDLLEEFSDRVQVRGIYSTAAFSPRADLMFWWVSRNVDDIQDLFTRMRRTVLGRSLEVVEAFMGLVRDAEFTRDHAPAFVKGEQPKRYACVYPFVRTPEWYLLDPAERGQMLADHGLLGREFPDVLPNTTSAFGLNDYEWILAFEADSPDRIVDLIRELRTNESRRYVKVEVPFFTGILKPLGEAVADLP